METLKLNCPRCLTTNQLPADKLQAKPKCGKCKEAMFIGEPLNLNSENLQATLVNNDIPVLVDCWAPWCGPCRSFAPMFASATRELEPSIRFAKLNTEANQQIAAQWGIRSIPTLVLFRGGQEVQRVSGILPPDELMRWLEQGGV